jgi:DNA replication protein DnaC
VRFTTAAGLVNELVEAKHKLELRRVMARWSRFDVIAIDEVGYVPLAKVGFLARCSNRLNTRFRVKTKAWRKLNSAPKRRQSGATRFMIG